MRWVVTLMPGRLTPGERAPRTQGQSRHSGGEERIHYPCRESGPGRPACGLVTILALNMWNDSEYEKIVVLCAYGDEPSDSVTAGSFFYIRIAHCFTWFTSMLPRPRNVYHVWFISELVLISVRMRRISALLLCPRVFQFHIVQILGEAG
jgi:hypothetical protein